MVDGGHEATAKVSPSSTENRTPLTPISLRKLTMLEREHTPVKSGRLRLSGIGTGKNDVVPASNRLSLKLAEQERQVRLARSAQNQKYMLLPDSMIRYWWDLLLALVTIVLIWRVPYTIAFGEGGTLHWYVFNKVSDTIYLIDVVINFRYVVAAHLPAPWVLSSHGLPRCIRTGYTEDAEVIMDGKKVAIRYLKARTLCTHSKLRRRNNNPLTRRLLLGLQSWFLVDLVGSIPVEIIFRANSSGVERKAIKASFKYIKIPVRGHGA